jgi:hypothetical protein
MRDEGYGKTWSFMYQDWDVNQDWDINRTMDPAAMEQLRLGLSVCVDTWLDSGGCFILACFWRSR